MNNKVIVLWGLIIFGLVITIYVIGINEQKKEDYTEFKETLKLSVNNYLDDYNAWPKEEEAFKIELKKLLEIEYINSLIYNDRECSGTIEVTKEKNKYNYDYDITCVKQITE